MNFQNNIIAPLITAGALGFVNYSILSRLDTINLTKEMKEDKKAYMMLFGAMNYFLFTFIQYLLAKIFTINAMSDIFAFFITLILTVICTYKIGDKIGMIVNKAINDKRQKSGKSLYDSNSVKNLAFNLEKSCPMYVYDFDNKLIWTGYSGWFSTDEELDFEFTSVPFNAKPEMLEYEDVLEYIQSIDVESRIYINTNKRVKIILLIS